MSKYTTNVSCFRLTNGNGHKISCMIFPRANYETLMPFAYHAVSLATHPCKTLERYTMKILLRCFHRVSILTLYIIKKSLIY